MYYFLIVSIKLHTARWSLNVCICLKVRMERENLSLNNLQECSFSALRDFIYGGWEINDLPIRYTFTLYSINFQIFFFGGGGGVNGYNYYLIKKIIITVYYMYKYSNL